MASSPEQAAVFLLKHLLGYDHRPEWVNKHNASYRMDVENVAQILDVHQQASVRLGVLDGPTGATEQWRNEAETNRQGYLKAVARAEQAEARVAALEGLLERMRYHLDHDEDCPAYAEMVNDKCQCCYRADRADLDAALSAPGQPEGR
jgi:hypothetical protein